MDAQKWNKLIAALPGTHVLQTWEWAQVKARYGWKPMPTVWHDRQGEAAAAAMVLARKVPVAGRLLGLTMLYVPKGPLLRDWDDAGLRGQVLGDLQALARRNRAIFIKIDPDVCLGAGIPSDRDAIENPRGQAVMADLMSRRWRFSEEQVQFKNTVLIDLTLTEKDLLMNMKQKTRYNVRLAGRKGVEVRVGNTSDIGMLAPMYAETSLRDEFVIRDEGYYRAVWDTFFRAGMAEPLIAEVQGEPVAAVVVFRFGGKAWYLHGMSRDVHREKMPNYLLQWEAMRRAKQAGCSVYDLWGAPDEFSESDSLWGVYRFKEGLGGKVVRHIGAWDLPVRPVYYWLYTRIAPRVLDWMRWRGRSQTESALPT
ncbi:MAG TPA: peptidoglycan bridge formation glycyltransferase FemA/FemB family protein [Anaerolineales bacterium]|jgi:lipid II:glycine glycyltransferase (peptidoglycan interpeptide bridge formation enzyme)|nr:peptidoglycan bridge formation glycyltransferase FemA/FemB family protein [Anaerolineales bacterium]